MNGVFMSLFIHIFAWLAVFASAVIVYLKMNKMWKHKHENEVAESISILGSSLGVVTNFAMFLLFFIQRSYQGAIDLGIYVLFECFLFLVAIKFWVYSERRFSWLQKFKNAIRLERKEIGILTGAFFDPSRKEILLELFSHVIAIDKTVDNREKELLNQIADEWELQINEKKIESYCHRSLAENAFAIRGLLQEFLDKKPPKIEVSRLIDLLQQVTNADDNVVDEEILVFDEIKERCSFYLKENGEQMATYYTVYVVPQNDEHYQKTYELFPKTKPTERLNSNLLEIEVVCSEKSAKIACEYCHDHNLPAFYVTNIPAKPQ